MEKDIYSSWLGITIVSFIVILIFANVFEEKLVIFFQEKLNLDFVEIFNKYVVKILGILVVIIVGFILHKAILFNKRKDN